MPHVQAPVDYEAPRRQCSLARLPSGGWKLVDAEVGGEEDL